MEGFLVRHRTAVVLTIVLSLQFILLGYQVRTNNDVRLLRVWAVTLIMPAQKAMNSVTGFVVSSWRDYVWLRDARRENERLREELDKLKLEQQQLRRALARFERAEGFLEYQDEIASETVLAEVIAAGANPNAREIFVDKGARSGIKPGMAVITPDGIVGKIQAVHSSTSLVLLINDPDAAAGVILTGSGVHGVIKGTGKDECRVDYISHEVEVKVGEKLFTSGDDRIFPKGLPAAEVTRLSEGGGEYQEVYAAPFAKLNRLDEVLIVTRGMHEDRPELYRPQAPEVLLPAPSPSKDPLTSNPLPESPQQGEAGANAEEAPPGSAQEEPLTGPVTDADRLKRRYQSLGAAQGHVFGEGPPGSRPPDFNLGIPLPEEAPTQSRKVRKTPASKAAAPAPAPAPAATPSSDGESGSQQESRPEEAGPSESGGESEPPSGTPAPGPAC